jgi:hypothetical protein
MVQEMNDVDVEGDGELSFLELAQALHMLKVKRVKMDAAMAKRIVSHNEGVSDKNLDYLQRSFTGKTSISTNRTLLLECVI